MQNEFDNSEISGTKSGENPYGGVQKNEVESPPHNDINTQPAPQPPKNPQGFQYAPPQGNLGGQYYGPSAAPPLQPTYYAPPFFYPYNVMTPQLAQQAYYSELVKKEKKAVLKNGVMVGLCIIVSLMVMVAVSFISALFESVGGDFFLADNGMISDSLLYVFISTLSFGVPALVFSFATKLDLTSAVGFGKPKKGTAIPVFLMSLGVMAFANIAADIIVSIFDSMGISPMPEQNTAVPSTWAGIVLWFISTAAIPALCEEILCRGFIFGSLRKHGDKIAMFISALIFGMIHGNFVQIPFAFFLGLVLAYSVIVTGSIWTAVAIHFFNNFMSCVLTFANQNSSQTVSGLTYLAYILVLICLGIVGIIIKKAKSDKFKKADNRCDSVLTVGQRVGKILSSPTIIIVFVYCFFNAVACCFISDLV